MDCSIGYGYVKYAPFLQLATLEYFVQFPPVSVSQPRVFYARRIGVVEHLHSV